MKVVVFFAPAFNRWAQEIVKIMSAKVSNLEVFAIAQNHEIYNELKACSEISYKKIYNLSLEEKKWVEDEALIQNVKALEEQFGQEVLVKTVIADKVLGAGWVNGAEIVEIELGRMIRSNKDIILRYIGGLYAFYRYIYETHKPDLTFLYAVAGGPAYALAKTAQNYNGIFRRFTHSRVGGFYILDSSERGQLDTIKKLLLESHAKPFLLQDYREKAVAWINEFRQNQDKPSFFIANQSTISRKQKWSSLLKSFLAVLYRTLKNIISIQGESVRKKNEKYHLKHKVIYPLKKKYKWNSKYYKCFYPYQNESYIFFPLHVEPEASTLVANPYHTNQISIIEALSKSTPLSFRLLVKEHPTMAGIRPTQFYKAIEKMPNVVLIDPSVSSTEMIKSASLTATISGTVGWESLLMKKPLLLMGEVPYMAVGEGFVYCPDLSYLHQAIPEALKTPPASDDALTDYIAAIIKEGIIIPDELLWHLKSDFLEKHKDVTEIVAERLIDILKSSEQKLNRPMS